MIQYDVFPQGKKKVVTFSYDDGSKNDVRLIELFNKYGIKGSFHLNGKNYINASEERIKELRELYKGHEISCHTLTHGWPSLIPEVSLINEVFTDRKVLENIARYAVIGMSYPSGDFSPLAIKAMESCGIVYSRTTKSTNNFKMPESFMLWHPTCHHNNAEERIDKFLEVIDSEWYGPLLYIWGHSHEFRSEQQWEDFEKALQKIANNDKIWYATNIEIYNYVKAQRNLVISADEKIIYNPSAVKVYVSKNKSQIIEIPAGKTYTEI